MNRGRTLIPALFLGALLLLSGRAANDTDAQAGGPEMLVRHLGVRTTVENLITPISMAFIGANDFLVVEKNTVTDIQYGPSGNLFVVSIDTGSVFKIFRRR